MYIYRFSVISVCSLILFLVGWQFFIFSNYFSFSFFLFIFFPFLLLFFYSFLFVSYNFSYLVLFGLFFRYVQYSTVYNAHSISFFIARVCHFSYMFQVNIRKFQAEAERKRRFSTMIFQRYLTWIFKFR